MRPQPHGVKVYVGESESERGFPIKIPNDKVAITMSALRMALDQELEEAFEDAEQASQDSVLPLL